MYERERKALRNESTRRLVFELLVFGTLVTTFLRFVLEPFLLFQFPELFQSGSSPQRVLPPVRMLPTTRVGWVNGGLGALALGVYLCYRLYFTELGADILEFYDESR